MVAGDRRRCRQRDRPSSGDADLPPKSFRHFPVERRSVIGHTPGIVRSAGLVRSTGALATARHRTWFDCATGDAGLPRPDAGGSTDRYRGLRRPGRLADGRYRLAGGRRTSLRRRRHRRRRCHRADLSAGQSGRRTGRYRLDRRKRWRATSLREQPRPARPVPCRWCAGVQGRRPAVELPRPLGDSAVHGPRGLGYAELPSTDRRALRR